MEFDIYCYFKDMITTTLMNYPSKIKRAKKKLLLH